MGFDLGLASIVGNLSYLLLVLALLQRSLSRLRVLVAASAALAILHGLAWTQDPSGLLWQFALLAVSVLMISRALRARREGDFTPDESAFRQAALPDLPPQKMRRLLSLGNWSNGTPGACLTEQGKPVLYLYWLARGGADVTLDGQRIGHLNGGSFVGELSLLETGPATATVTLTGEARYWMVPVIKLRDLKREEPELWAPLEAALSRDLGRKLREMNAGAVAG